MLLIVHAIMATSMRSSVRPKSSKQPWGTILKPEFGLGHQKMTEYEVEQSVNRLYFVQTRDEPRSERKNPNNKPDLDSEGVQTIVSTIVV